MSNLADHVSNNIVKLLVIGNSKSGKTGGLTSLVKAGYKLRILDMDNLLEVLKHFVLKECPEMIGNVEFRTLRDLRKAGPEGPVISGMPKAFQNAIRMLDRWKYTADDGREIDLGPPCEWGPDCILVIDSLSRLCDAAYDFREPLTPRGAGGKYDARAVYGDAQDAIEATLATITADSFFTNVIVIAHVLYMELPDGTIKGFPQGVGQKLSPKIPQYFSSTVLFTNKGGNRVIQTTSTPLIDLANPKPFAMAPTYPIETGLADFFETLKQKPAKLRIA